LNYIYFAYMLNFDPRILQKFWDIPWGKIEIIYENVGLF
jgi:hypothetical protein